MNILYYHWNENSAADIRLLFKEFGYLYAEVSYPLQNYDSDSVFEEQLDKLLLSKHFDIIFTFNYFPILSKIAQRNKIPYVSWVYDCPNLTLYSKTITNTCNYLFIFDRGMYENAISLGAGHAFHLPLAVNTKRLGYQLFFPDSKKRLLFAHEISFIGSLYENNMYQQVNYLPNYLRGYLDGLMSAQQKIWGCSLLEELLTEDIVKEMREYIKLEDNPDYTFTAKDIFLNLLDSNITFLERTSLLTKVSGKFPTDIYSGSPLDGIRGCTPHGFVSYTDEMPRIFANSKINLNITLRSIRQGIPLRCLDIMGAGGFLLSNYQPELFEFFVPGEEFVCFESEEDLLQKMQYYLQHEAERMKIAKNGQAKICSHFSYPVQFQKIIQQIPSVPL